MATSFFELYRNAVENQTLSEFLSGIFSLNPANIADRKVAVQRSQRPIAPEILDALRSSSFATVVSEARENNLQLLSSGKAVAVVSGQQTSLFLGPAMLFWKACSLITTASALQRETGIPCVPIFWAQDEDHDIAEMNHVHLDRKGQAGLKLVLETATDRVSARHVLLSNGVLPLLDILRQEFSHLPHGPEIIELLRIHYQPEKTYSEAFIGLLEDLFSKEGLVVFDPRQSAVSSFLSPIYKKTLLLHEEISQRLLAQEKLLASKGISTQQVHIRSDSPLLFHHLYSEEGPRYRLKREGKHQPWSFAGVDGSLTEDELCKMISQSPMRFSSSALLRPLLQDLLFPTAGFVGGPAECGYLAQISPLYELFDLPQPLILPRMSGLILRTKISSALDSIGLSPIDLRKNRDEIVKSLGDKRTDRVAPEMLLGEMIQSRSNSLDLFARKANLPDEKFATPLKKTRQNMEFLAQKLTDRYRAALGEEDSGLVEQISRFQEELYPSNLPQERWYALVSYLCRYGKEEMAQKAFAAFSPFSAGALSMTSALFSYQEE